MNVYVVCSDLGSSEYISPGMIFSNREAAEGAAVHLSERLACRAWAEEVRVKETTGEYVDGVMACIAAIDKLWPELREEAAQ